MSKLRAQTLSLFATAGLIACLACGAGSKPAEIEIPEREKTSGDVLLPWISRDADVILEVDLDRLRRNPVLSPLILSYLGADAPPSPEKDSENRNWLTTARSVVLAGLAIGRDNKKQRIYLQSDVALPLPTIKLGPGIWGIDVPEMEQAMAAQGESVASDPAFMRLRTLAMPAKAAGASFRFTARFDSVAKKALVAKLGLSMVPQAVSAWGDVADDAALVVVLSVRSAKEAKMLAQELTEWAEKLLLHAPLTNRLRRQLAQSINISREDMFVKATWVLSPGQFQALVKMLLRGRTPAPDPPVIEPSGASPSEKETQS